MRLFPNSDNGVGTLFEQGGGGRKYKVQVSFCQKMVNHLHQPALSAGEGFCTFSSYLT